MSRLLAQSTPLGGRLKGIGGYDPDLTGADAGAGAANQFTQFASNFIGFLTVVAGIWFLLQFLLGALKWISAGGDANKVEEAKKQLTNSAIGLIAVVASLSIVFIIGSVLGLNLLQPGDIIENLIPTNTETRHIDTNPLDNRGL